MRTVIGSPPRMRGKLRKSAGSPPRMRITPADAGKTVKVGRPEIRDKDHPRGCGENISQMRSFIILPGSPPRMRGKLIDFRVFLTFDGITPADAGKTFTSLLRHNRFEDHPRGCGENPAPTINVQNANGSPPRMRGKRQKGGRQPPDGGITPADAGKTSQPALRHAFSQDHPRGCGENSPVLLSYRF